MTDGRGSKEFGMIYNYENVMLFKFDRLITTTYILLAYFLQKKMEKYIFQRSYTPKIVPRIRHYACFDNIMPYDHNLTV